MAKKNNKTFLIIDPDTKEVYTAQEWSSLKGVKHINAKLRKAFPDNIEKVIRVSGDHPAFLTKLDRAAPKGGRPCLEPRKFYVSPNGVAFTRTAPADWTVAIDPKTKTASYPGGESKTIEWEAGLFLGKRRQTPDVLL